MYFLNLIQKIVDSDDDMMIDELQETSFYSTENNNTFYSMLSGELIFITGTEDIVKTCYCGQLR